MLHRCARRDSQDFVINSGTAIHQQIRNHLIPSFPQVLSAKGIGCTQNFNSLHYICLPTSISWNRWEDLTSGLGLLFWCKAKLALAKLVWQQCCSKRDWNAQYKSLILPKFWANYCSNSNELFLEKLHLENKIFRAVSDKKFLLMTHFTVWHLTSVTSKTRKKYIYLSHAPVLLLPITFSTFICVVMPKNHRWALEEREISFPNLWVM